jgi:hypothetical protein
MSKKNQIILTESKDIEGIVPITLKIGDQLTDVWNNTQDLKAAMGALAAYNMAIKAHHESLIDKKLTGSSKIIKQLSS